MLLSLITSGTVPSLPSWVGRIQNQVESRAKAYTALKEAYGTHSMTALSEVIAKYAMAAALAHRLRCSPAALDAPQTLRANSQTASRRPTRMAVACWIVRRQRLSPRVYNPGASVPSAGTARACLCAKQEWLVAERGRLLPRCAWAAGLVERLQLTPHARASSRLPSTAVPQAHG